MKAWLKAFRLRTLPLSFSTILVANAIAYVVLEHHLNYTILTLTLITTLFLQILSNLANDYGDALKGADNENRIGPERAIQSGAISKNQMKTAIIIFSVFSLISGLALLFVTFENFLSKEFLIFLGMGLLSILAAITYTVGKRAYGYHGLGDVFVFIFFGLIGVSGSLFLQVKFFDWIFLLPGITMGCFSVAVLNLNNMRDRVNDEAVGKITIPVRLGQKNAKIYHGILFVIAWLAFPLAYFVVTKNFWFILFVYPVSIIHLLHLYKVYKVCDPKDFDPELKKVALSSFLFSILIFIYFIYF